MSTRFQYLQIYNKTFKENWALIVVSCGRIPKEFLAKCYKILATHLEHDDIFRTRWQSEFLKVLDPQQWIQSYNYACNIFCNVNIEENVYNLYTLWCYTPLRLKIMYWGLRDMLEKQSTKC